MVKKKSKYREPDKCPHCYYWVVKVRRTKGGFETSEGCVSEEEICASCAFVDVR
jgi:hypothetical protein